MSKTPGGEQGGRAESQDRRGGRRLGRTAGPAASLIHRDTHPLMNIREQILSLIAIELLDVETSELIIRQHTQVRVFVSPAAGEGVLVLFSAVVVLTSDDRFLQILEALRCEQLVGSELSGLLAAQATGIHVYALF